MATTKTEFDPDECQALLDLIDKLKPKRDDFVATCPHCETSFDVSRWPPGGIECWNLVDICTEEETAVYAKLKKAGEFYMPKTRS